MSHTSKGRVIEGPGHCKGKNTPLAKHFATAGEPSMEAGWIVVPSEHEAQKDTGAGFMTSDLWLTRAMTALARSATAGTS